MEPSAIQVYRSIVEPSTLIIVKENPKEILKISNHDNLLSIEPLQECETSHLRHKFEAQAIYGFYPSNQSINVFFVTKSKKIANIQNKSIYLVTKVRYISLGEFENYFIWVGLRSIKYILENFFVYFSPSFNLSQNFSHQSAPREEFIVNSLPCTPLFDKKLLNWFVPCIQGAVVSKGNMSIISRRVMKRAGIRWFSRGANSDGDISNLVETEFLMQEHLNDGKIKNISYTLLRGSIPFKWTQKPDLNYDPFIDLSVATFDENLVIIEKHFTWLLKTYGSPTVVLNLINKNHQQLKIGKLYEKFIENSSHRYSVPFVWFDYNNQIKNWKKDQIKLINSISSYLHKIAFSEYITDGEYKFIEKLKSQGGVLRLNCMDSIDRTNAGQYLICKNIFQDHMNAEDLKMFKELWVDNGDILALGYTRTQVLRKELVLNDTRTILSTYKDSLISLKRYMNQFEDGAITLKINLAFCNMNLQEYCTHYVLAKKRQTLRVYYGLPIVLPLIADVLLTKYGKLSTFKSKIMFRTVNYAAFIFLCIHSARKILTTLINRPIYKQQQYILFEFC